MRKRACIVTMIFLLVMGCGTIGQEEKKQEETTSNSLFVPMEEGEDSDSPVITEMIGLAQGEGLCEVLEEKEVPLAEFCNATNEILEWEKWEGFFYVDEKTGVSYFININQDWYIYRIKDEEVKMAVALPAKQLQVYDGSLYFMIDFHDKYEIEGMRDGDIYRYTPETGEVTFLYRPGENVEGFSTQLSTLKVRETGIHFSYSIATVVETGTRHQRVWEYLPFGETKAVEDISRGAELCWNDYYFQDYEDNISLISKEDKQNKIVALEKKMPYGIVGDDLYYMNVTGLNEEGLGNAKIGKKNLITGEVEELDFLPMAYSYSKEELKEEIEKDKEVWGTNVTQWYLWDFGVTHNGEYVWVLVGELGCYELKTGEFTDYRSFTKKSYNIKKFYSDGEHLYATAIPNGSTEQTTEEDYRLCRVYTEKDEMSEEMRKELEEAQDYWNEKLYMVEPLVK